MKKWMIFLLSLVLITIIAGCLHKTPSGMPIKQNNSVSDVLEAAMAEENAKKDEGVLTENQKDNNTSDEDDFLQAGSEGQTGETSKEDIESTLQDDVMEETIGNEQAAEAKEADETEKNAYTEEDIDVDLTTLSSIMVYSEVYNMMLYPDDYIGKTVKMEGAFAQYYDEATDKTYFACVIADATACCSQGLEFEPTEDYVYPDDYPADGENVCVIGVFDTYEEGDYYYCTLRNAKMF
ncbi:MAG: hypothetical protein K5988_07945 [Lachnospiraceae bacterium]|nr:hypothetical protein [Lachnospiraceae bacterium]